MGSARRRAERRLGKAPQVLFRALLLGPRDNRVFFGMLGSHCVGFARQGISVELFARAAPAGVTTLLALSSPGGCAAKKSRQEAVFSAGSLPAQLPCPSLPMLLCHKPLVLVLPSLPASRQLLSYPFCPSAAGQSTLIFRQKCCNN